MAQVLTRITKLVSSYSVTLSVGIPTASSQRRASTAVCSAQRKGDDERDGQMGGLRNSGPTQVPGAGRATEDRCNSDKRKGPSHGKRGKASRAGKRKHFLFERLWTNLPDLRRPPCFKRCALSTSRESGLSETLALHALEGKLYYFCFLRAPVVCMGAELPWRAWSYPGLGARPGMARLGAERARGDLPRPVR